MAGIAIVLDLLRKTPNSYSTHSSGLFSATAAASAAAVSVAAGTPFASRFLFGNARIPVAHCDAGAPLPEDLIANIRSLSGSFLQPDSIKYTTKEYQFELKPLFSAFELRALALTTLRSLFMFYLPLLEPRTDMEEDEDNENFLEDTPEERVDFVVPLRKSVKQIIRETTVVTTRRVLERMVFHYVSQQMAWKLLKDAPKSAMRKADRGMPTLVYFFKVGRTTFRGHLLGVAASWLVQVGIEVYQFWSGVLNSKEETDEIDTADEVKVLGKRISCVSVRCGSSLVFASIGAGIGALLFRPSLGQWVGCALGDLGGPIIVGYCLEKADLDFLSTS